MSARVTTAIIVGAGALGAACARRLAERGVNVTLLDPGEPSASAVAAGMLAPAFEAALEDASPERAALYRAGRDRWPDLAAVVGLELGRAGAAWVPVDAEGERQGRVLSARLRRLGFAVDGDEAAPATPDDWTLDAEDALKRIAAGLPRVAARALQVTPTAAGFAVELDDGRRLTAELCVLATGAGAPPAGAGAAVLPIKGQLAWLDASAPDRVLRTSGAYVVPARSGVLVGATMEPGRSDVRPDPEVFQPVLDDAVRAWPPLAQARSTVLRAGVRGATPDGLPLVGPLGPGLLAALAPRRNGWLLAPLVAEGVAAYALGDDPGPFAAALHPSRFLTR